MKEYYTQNLTLDLIFSLSRTGVLLNRIMDSCESLVPKERECAADRAVWRNDVRRKLGEVRTIRH